MTIRGGFILLAVVATLGVTEQAVGQGPPSGLNVNVVNTPLPVTGSVTGTVTLAPGTAVEATVVNPANMPTLTSSIDDRGRVAYQSTITQACDATTHFCTFTFPPVPSSHRLVINHISGDVRYQSNANHTIVFLNTSTGGLVGRQFYQFFPPVLGGETVFDQSVLVYFDGGTAFEVNVEDLSGAFVGSGSQIMTVTGYLLDCTAAPCAPIAQ
jgi:hypothetical protein